MDNNNIIIRVAPFTFIHVLDTNSNVTRVLSGPVTYTRQDHEKIVLGPEKMVTIPPRHYVRIENPAARDSSGNLINDKYGQVKLRYGDEEIRLGGNDADPFPLYPGERVKGDITRLLVVRKNEALHLVALRDTEVETDNGSIVPVTAGEEFLFHGPKTYFPKVEVKVKGMKKSIVISHSQALRLRAKRSLVDSHGIERCAGEEWLLRDKGAYMPQIEEEVVATVEAVVLTEKKALWLSAKRTYTDVYGIQRKAGEEWLVTFDMSELHIPDVYEEEEGIVEITTLTSRQYCVVVDPWVDGEQKLGSKEMRKGEASFFLKPGERLLRGVENVYVLGEDEGVLLSCTESFVDEDIDHKETGITRKPGDIWLIRGPREFIPSVQVKILEIRKAMPLDKNEGVYVRDKRNGTVRSVIGPQAYLLKPDEELWEKELPDEVEALLAKQALGQCYVPTGKSAKLANKTLLPTLSKKQSERDRTKVVQFRVPHNAAVQIYDFKSKQCRVLFGPELCLLGPDEQFTVLSLSGDKPKRPNQIKSLCLMLGPDFMTDIIQVETADHARLELTLSYNWQFMVNKEDPSAIFSVRDFTGDACKAIASRIRGAVASESFDTFHKHSAKIIRGSVFGMNAGKVGEKFCFPNNGLSISNIDIQAVEPVDASTRESLQKSVSLAIAITSEAQEARARQDAFREEEQAKGLLERQKLSNEAQAEEERRNLLELKAKSSAIQSSGQAKAEATARAEALEIEALAQVKRAELKAEAMKIEMESELASLQKKHEVELKHKQALAELELEKAKRLADIETSKFSNAVKAIGAETIKDIARAGPEMQAKLLQGLGLNGYLVTDGKNPINLFNTAKGLIGANPVADA